MGLSGINQRMKNKLINREKIAIIEVYLERYDLSILNCA